MSSATAPVVDWKKKYKDLKKRAKTLIFEQECLQQEVEKGQQKILKIQRDNSFLLERLSQYEQVLVEDPHDFDATDSSDNEVESSQPPPKKKKNLQNSSVKTSKAAASAGGGDTQKQQVSKLGYDFKCRDGGSVKQEQTEQEIQQQQNCDISSTGASVFVGSTPHVEGIVKQEAI